MMSDIGLCVTNALRFSKTKLILTFLGLVICGMILLFFKTLSFQATSWVQVGLVFFPVLLSFFILLFFSDTVVGIHHMEKKSIKVDYKEILVSGFEEISILTLSPLFAFVLLWAVLGVFSLIRTIPHFGEGVSALLSFVPFTIIFGFVLLSFLSLVFLFFLPAILKSYSKKQALSKLKKQVFSKGILYFFIGLIPLGIMGKILYSIAIYSLTHFTYPISMVSKVVSLFFIMIPFCVILSPFFLFFFLFSYEIQNIK